MRTRRSSERTRASAASVLAVWCGLGLAVPTVTLGAVPSRGVSARADVTKRAATKEPGAKAIDAIPLYFEEGAGANARYTARADGYALALDEGGVSIALGRGAGTAADVVRMRFAGASATAPAGEGLLAGKANRIAGTDPSGWRQGIRTFSRVRYANVYPGVDAVCYGTRRDMEYDLVVAPGASASAIRLAFDGARSVSVADDGALVVKTAKAEIRQKAPVAYQETPAGRRAVSCGYAVRGAEACFELGAYDRALPLVVDPVLSYATYVGGRYLDDLRGLAVGADGAMYVVGMTTSPDFPAVRGAAATPDAGNLFVAKIAPSGTELVYSTTFAGNIALNVGTGVAVDAKGNAFVAGSVNGPGFPTKDALDSAPCLVGRTAALLKLGPTGELIFSTFLGGSVGTEAFGVALDPDGNPVVVGSTIASDFPLVSPVQPNNAYYAEPEPARADGFVTKLSADGRQRLFSTTLGGTQEDDAYGVAVDASGAIYAVGRTWSADVPTTAGSVGAAHPGCPPVEGEDCSHGFVAKITPDYRVGYFTYLGGSWSDWAVAVAADRDGNAYVTGTTNSPDFPTKNPLRAQRGTTFGDAFVTKIAPDGASFVYSTFLGGERIDDGRAIAVDGAGRATVVGATHGTDLPQVDALAGFSAGGPDGPHGFAATLDPSGASLVFSTFVGDSTASQATAVVAGSDGALYVAGISVGPDMPFVTPLRVSTPNPDETGDGFVLRIGTPDRSPRVTGVRVVRKANGKPARLVIDGVRFDPAMRVFVGDALVPAASLKGTDAARRVVKNAGGVLGSLPSGVETFVRCVNPDGGEGRMAFAP